MDGKSDYESLRKQYTSSLSSLSKKIMESIFRSAKPIEFSSGKPMERFSGAEWRELFRQAVWDKPTTSKYRRRDIHNYGVFLVENGASFDFNALEETTGQQAESWGKRYFISFEEMERTFLELPFRGGSYNKKALVLALLSLGLQMKEIAALNRTAVDENKRTVRVERLTIEDVEPFVFRFLPLTGEQLIQTQSQSPVTEKTVENIAYRVFRQQEAKELSRSIAPKNLAESYFFLKLRKYERISGELIENLAKREWFYEQCRKWSGLVDDKIIFSSLIRDYNRLKKLE
jgi:hypothetical protein